jgi:hypothetical protein
MFRDHDAAPLNEGDCRVTHPPANHPTPRVPPPALLPGISLLSKTAHNRADEQHGLSVPLSDHVAPAHKRKAIRLSLSVSVRNLLVGA